MRGKCFTWLLALSSWLLVNLWLPYLAEAEAPPIVKNAQFKSVKDGNWNDPNSWDPIGIPASGDPVTIQHTITTTGIQASSSLTITAVGILQLDTTAGCELTLDDGATLNNNGEIRYVGDNSNDATLTSAGSSVYTSTASSGVLDWNDRTRCQYGNFIHEYGTFSVTGTAAVTLIGDLTCKPDPINIIDSGATLTHTAPNATLFCKNGDFSINGRFEMGAPSANTYLYLNPASDGQVGIIVSGTGEISATGQSSTARCYLSSSTDYTIYIELQNSSAVLFQYCDISKIATSTGAPNKYGIYADNVDGANDDGTADEGLTIDNCWIHDGKWSGIWLLNCTENHITNNEIYDLEECGIYFSGSAVPGGDTEHEIYSNKIYNIPGGGANYGYGIWISQCYTSKPITDTIIYACGKYGFQAQRIGENGYYNEQVFRDCSFGTSGANSQADIGFTGTFSGVRLENCILASPNEVAISTLDNSDDRIVSIKHDKVDGLWRVWGEWTPTATGQIIKIRYDTESYPGAGDNDVQKIVEFGPSNIGSKFKYRTVGGGVGAGLELVGKDDNTQPVIFRSVDGTTTYGITVAGTASNKGKLAARWCSFQNLDDAGLKLDTNSIISTTSCGYDSLECCSFSNNSASGRHLNLVIDGNWTVSSDTFDTSTQYDVSVDASTNITFTNYTNSRAGDADDKSGGGTVTWDPGTTLTYRPIYAASDWSVVTDWDDKVSGAYNGVNDSGVVPNSGDTVEVITGVAVTLTITNGSWACANLIVGSGNTLTFDMSGGNVTLKIDNGGVIINSGSITFDTGGASGRIVNWQVMTPTEATMWVFQGNPPDWAPASGDYTINIGDCDFRTTIITTASTGMKMVFDNDMKTKAVDVINDGSLKFEPSASAVWEASGDITVGTAAATSGLLELKPNTTLTIKCGSNGQYGLIVDANGTITATGTSAASPDCIITSGGTYRSYIYARDGSESWFKNCTISNMGIDASPKYGLYVNGVNGAGEHFEIEGCTISNSYAGISLSGCANTVISGCNISGCNNDGIYILNSNNNDINFNICENNGTAGIILEGSSDNILNLGTNYLRNNGQDGIRLLNGSNNNTISGSGAGGHIYGNARAGIYLGQSSPISNTIQDCNLGTSSDNLYDIYVDLDNTITSTLVLKNCKLDSTNKVYWAQNSPGAGTYIISYKHDQVPGQIKVWGDYLVSSGTEEWCTSSTYDGGTAKTVTFGPGPSGINNGKSRLRIDTSATLNMATGNNATNYTELRTSNSELEYSVIISGTIDANFYQFQNLDENGLYITAPVGNITSLDNGEFLNCNPSGRFIYFDNISFGGSKAIDGCSFDNSTMKDITVNIGTSNYITMTNYVNDNPGTKDEETSGYVDWLWTGGPYFTVQDGDWWATATWNGGNIPPDGADVTINNDVTLTGTVTTGNLVITPTVGALRLDGSPDPVELIVTSGLTITNNGAITITDNTVQIRSSNGPLGFFDYEGNDIEYVNGRDLTIGLCNYQVSTMTIPSNTTVTFSAPGGNDTIMKTRAVEIVSGGELRHQTSGKEWRADGDILVSGVLRLGANTMTRIACSFNGEHGLIVESTGLFEASGSGPYGRNCIITQANYPFQAGQYPYIWLKPGSETVMRYVTVAGVGCNAPNKWGIYAESIDGSVANAGLTIDSCNVYSSTGVGIYLKDCPNNPAPSGVQGNWIHRNKTGFVFEGTIQDTTIEDNYVYTNTDVGLVFRNTTARVELANIYLTAHPRGMVLTGTNNALVMIDSSIASSATADIYCNSGATFQLRLANCILGSSSEIDPANLPDTTGAGILSLVHDQTAGLTVIWGDYTLQDATQRFNYADETYLGAGDADTRKYLRFGPSGIPALRNGSLLTVDSSAALQAIGTASNRTTFESLGAGNNCRIKVNGSVDAYECIFDDMYSDLGSLWIGSGGILTQLDNCDFTGGTVTTTYLTLMTGQTITATGCYFDNNNLTDVKVRPNASSVPTVISFVNYTNDNPGTKDDETGNSYAIWEGTMRMYDTSDPSANVSQGDQDRAFLRLKFEPSAPAGSQHDEGILESLVVSLTGVVITDSDVAAIKIYRDDSDDNFEPGTEDILVSSGTDVFSDLLSNITLTTPQPITPTLCLWVAYDISSTASTTATIGAEVITATVTAPHTLDSTNFPFGSANRTISVANYRADGQIKRAVDTTWLGDDIYNTTGVNQTKVASTANNQLISYYIRIQNDSDTNDDSFTITCPSTVGSGWTITYYDGTSPSATDITSSVTSTGWSTTAISSTMPAGSYIDIRLEVEPSTSMGASLILDTYITSSTTPSANFQDMVKAKTEVYDTRPDVAVGVPSGTKDTWLGDDLWYPPDEQKTITSTVRNTWLTYYVQIQNDGGSTDTITVTGTAGGGGWTISYYRTGEGEITDQVTTTSTGWSTGLLGSGDSKEIWVEIVASDTVAGGLTKEIAVWAGSDDMTDQVKIDVTLQKEYQTDLLIKKGISGSWLGDDKYDPPETQEIVEGVLLTQMITYYVRQENEGNTRDSFIITATAPGSTKTDDWNWTAADGSTWTITYYYGAQDITPDVVGAGWLSPPIEPAGTFEIKIQKTVNSGSEYDEINVEVGARSGNDSSAVDKIKAKTVILSFNQPDAMVSADNNPPWEKNNEYELSNQVIEKVALADTWVTYYIKIQNDGMSADYFSVTGTAGGSGWTVSYYDSPTSANDITADITNWPASPFGWLSASRDRLQKGKLQASP